MKRSSVGKHVAIALVFIFLISIVTGCGSQTSKITVIMPKHEMDNKGFFEKETRNFEKETGIKVELINMAWGDVSDRVVQEMAAGGSSYDVIEFDNGWVSKFIENKWLEPLDKYDGASDIKTGMLPGLTQKFSKNGQLYGVTWNNDTRFFMYNKKMLDAAGITAPPKTWDELESQTKILQQKGIAKFAFIDAFTPLQTLNQLTYFIYSFGGNYFDNNGSPIMTKDEGIKKAFEFLERGVLKDKFIDPACITSDLVASANVFYKGDTAFFLQAWPGVYAASNDASISKIAGQVEVAPYAVGVDENTNVVMTLPESLAIPTTSKNKDKAWKYIKYMTSKEFEKKKAMEIGALPCWKDLFNDQDLLKSYPYWENFGKQAINSRGIPDLTWFDQFLNIIGAETQKVLMGDITAENGLKNIEDQCKQVIK